MYLTKWTDVTWARMHLNAGGVWRQHAFLFRALFLLVPFWDAVLAQEGAKETTSSEPVILYGYRGLFGTIGILTVACIVIPIGVLSILYLLFHRCISSRNNNRRSGFRSKGVFWIEEGVTESRDESDIISPNNHLSRRADEGRYSVNRSEDDLESTCLLCDSSERDRINIDKLSLLTFNECDASSVETNESDWSEMSFSDVKVIKVESETNMNGSIVRSNNSSSSDAIETPPSDITGVITQQEAMPTLVDSQPRPSAVVTGYNDVIIELMGKDKNNAPCCQLILPNDVINESFKTELKLFVPEI